MGGISAAMPAAFESSPSQGSHRLKVAPSPGRLSAQILPRWEVMIEWHITKPIPMPVLFVVKKGVKRCAITSAFIPAP